MLHTRHWINLICLLALLLPQGFLAAAPPTGPAAIDPPRSSQALSTKQARLTTDYPPLPEDCDGVAPPGAPAACCIRGYIFFKDQPQSAIEILITSAHGSIQTTPHLDGDSLFPHYDGDLASSPLQVVPGDVITLTARQGTMSSTITWTVQAGSQHVDIGLIEGYRNDSQGTQNDFPVLDSRHLQGEPYPAIPAKLGLTAQNVTGTLSMGGETRALAWYGNYLLVGEGVSLAVLDPTPPSTPKLIGKTLLFPDVIQNIEVGNTFALVTLGNESSDTYIVDLAIPTSPQVIKKFDISGTLSSLTISGTLAYAGTYLNGAYALTVLNIADPLAPVTLGKYTSPRLIEDITLQNGFAYAVMQGTGLLTLDISNPITPTRVSIFTLPAISQATVKGNYAYIVEDKSGPPSSVYLNIIDISNPLTYTSIYSLNLGFGTPSSEIYFYNAFIYASTSNGVVLIDVSNPAMPIVTGRTPSYTSVTLGSTTVKNHIAYIVYGTMGLQIFNILDPQAPTRIGSYNCLGKIPQIPVLENKAYLNDSYANKGLIFNLSKPLSPTLETVFNMTGTTKSTHHDSRSLYLLTDSDLQIMDTTGAVPVLTGRYTWTMRYGEDLAVVGNVALIAEGSTGIRILNISNPVSPTLIKIYDTPGYVSRIKVVGNLAYVADTGGGLRILDISTPATPTLVGSWTQTSVLDLQITNNLAYLVCDGGGFRILDVSNPADPQETGYYAMSSAENIVVAGGMAYVSDSNVLRIMDVTDPTFPNQVGFYYAPYTIGDIALVQGYIYLAGNDGGLLILKYTSAGSLLADFSATPRFGAPPLNVQFTDLSTGALTRTWDFGDGQTSQETHPAHTYTTAGNYTVTLTVTDGTNTDRKTMLNYITAGLETVQADFSAAVRSGIAPLSIQFTDLSTGALTRTWNFGDGASSTAINPGHVYTTPGTYSVTLTVFGTSSSDTELKTSYITVNYPLPQAAFTATPLTGTAPLTVQFTALGTTEISWLWNFGDGEISGARHPQHTYAAAGNYTVALKVTSPGGTATVTKTGYINVFNANLPSRTLLFYLAGDNNLDFWLRQSWLKIPGTQTGPNINVIALFDGAGRNDTYRCTYSSTTPWNCVNVGEKDMGNPQTLIDLVNSARDAAPNDEIYLTLADHGGGLQGISWESYRTQGNLTLAELETAFTAITAHNPKKLAAVHFDACLMGLADVAAVASNTADYVIVSPNLAFGVFAYNRYITDAVDAVSPRAYAAQIAAKYHAALPTYPHTIAVLDMGAYPAVVTGTANLVNLLQSTLPTHTQALSQTLAFVQRLDSRYYFLINRDDEYIDFIHWLQLVKQNAPNAGIQNAAQNLLDTLNSFVVVEYHQSNSYKGLYQELGDSHGPTLYFPPNAGVWSYNEYISRPTRFAQQTGWHLFLQKFFTYANIPPETPTEPALPPLLPVSLDPLTFSYPAPARGYTVINLSAVTDTLTRAQSLADYVGPHVKRIMRLGANSSMEYYDPVNHLGTNFTIRPGEPLFVEFTGTTSSTISFNGLMADYAFTLTRGTSSCVWNSISIPPTIAYPPVNAQELAAQLGGVENMLIWSPTTQSFDYWRPGTQTGRNFNVEIGRSYLVCLGPAARTVWP